MSVPPKSSPIPPAKVSPATAQHSMTSAAWPKQVDAIKFYGNPSSFGGAQASRPWENANLTHVKPPFEMHMGKIKITQIPVHYKCADALMAWLNKVWENADKNPDHIHLWGMDVFSGSFNYRPMRGINQLSMHAFGCAFDFDAPRNALGSHNPHLGLFHKEVVQPFLDLGGTWGGTWSRPDGMHFQFANVS